VIVALKKHRTSRANSSIFQSNNHLKMDAR
jgi:hypothetical protein